MRDTLKNKKGITLIALIITVIIMLILAGVAISVLTSDGGLFEKTQGAADMYKQAAQNEADKISSLMNDIDDYLNGTTQEPTPPSEPDPTESYPNGTWTGTVNEPKIDGTGLIPVKLDANGNPTELTPEQAKNTTWYNYVDTSITGNTNKSEWANAITKNSQGEITGYFVWIPRYEYKITYTNTSDKSKGGKIDVNFIPVDKTSPTSGYTIHPAFTDEKGTAPVFKNGGWKAEIPGFWVAKFEAGYAGKGKNDTNNDVTITDSGIRYSGTSATTNYYGTITSGTTTMKLPVFLPKTYAYNNINIGDIFNLSREIQSSNAYYGLNSSKVDSHMMKNSEWGAIAYLAHSKYGRNGAEITINNVNMNNKITTIYPITGYAGSEVSATANSLTAAPAGNILGDVLGDSGATSYAWNTPNGVLASSTGNIYGIYDLSGGSWEYTAGYLNLSSNTAINNYGGTFSKSATNVTRTTSTEYASVYNASGDGSDRDTNYKVAANTIRRGEAIWETSSTGSGSTSWNGDYSYFPYSSSPFFSRGGDYHNGANAGVFAFHYGSGGANVYNGFRAVLATL